VSSKETEYVFNHMLTQEVVYQSILLKSRKDMHRDIARAYAQMVENSESPDDFLLQQTAYHFALADDESTGVEYLKTAVSQRLSRYQMDSALALLNWGEKYFSTKHIVLMELSAGVHEDLGQFDRALALWSELIRQQEPRIIAVSARQLADLFRRKNQLGESRKCLEHGETFRAQVNSVELNLNYEKSWVNILRAEQNFAEALEHLEKGLAIATSLNDSQKVAEILNDLGALFLNLKDPKSAEESFLKAFQIAKELKDPALFIRVVMNLGSVFFIRNQIEEAAKYFTRAAKMAETVSDPWNRLLALHNLGLAYSKAKEYDRAEKSFETALDLSIKLALQKHRFANELHLNHVILKAKGREAGEQRFRDLIQEFAKAGQWMMFGEGVTLLSQYFKDYGESDLARRELELALQELSATQEESVKNKIKYELQNF
jgi:tetratricopeptide (TPR) repeat protein